MELELEAGGVDGRTNRVVPFSSNAETAELGRGDLGPAEAPPADRNVSRRHVSLRFLGGGDHKVAFEVVGRNPVVVQSADGNRVYRRAEAGELWAEDGLSPSLKAPLFFAVWRTNGEGEGEMDAVVMLSEAEEWGEAIGVFREMQARGWQPSHGGHCLAGEK